MSLPRPKVHSFEYGGSIYYVRALSGKGLSEFQKLSKDGAAEVAKVAALGLCDECGALLNDPETEQAEAEFLLAASAKLLEVSGLTRKPEEETKNS